MNHIYPRTIIPNAIRTRIAMPIAFFLRAKETPVSNASAKYTISNLAVKPIPHLSTNADLSISFIIQNMIRYKEKRIYLLEIDSIFSFGGAGGTRTLVLE